jgi:LEA14-like dessication related protein
MRRALLAALVPALLAGCGARWREPVVTPREVRTGTISLAGLDCQVDLDFYNPNPRPLPIRSIDFELTIGDSAPVPGHGDVPAPIPAGATQLVTVDVRISPLAALSVGAQLAGGRRDYRIEGRALVDSAFGEVSVGFDREGQLSDLTAPPSAY